MVDEALSQAGTEQKLANAQAGEPGPSSAERYAPRMLGGGTLHQAVEDICWIYRSGDLAENLRMHAWRKARRKVMRQGPLERVWISHRGGPPGASHAWRGRGQAAGGRPDAELGTHAKPGEGAPLLTPFSPYSVLPS